MDLYQVMMQRRTVRRFLQKPVDPRLLMRCVNVARLAPSAANLQPLDYVVVAEPEGCQRLFPALRWAAYLEPAWTPAVNERPTAYIVVLARNDKPFTLRDMGLACAHITLLAEAEGLGSCILCNIEREQIRVVLSVPDGYLVDSVIALGYKMEEPVLEEREDTVKYWRDKSGVLHVPKRPLASVLHYEVFGKKWGLPQE
jgi:nitroreductase